ncbi:pentatricopeptide repeat-containing protein At5g66520-like [Andrographis paniculata]|uniref:pentatricopeptide repeat-containing protein At5g66520-like n=1 Tax=Andrographis paniculata TaxID=175694 RepID=UPI0021E75DD3|nr:pentatricopeptide repeat-containing protein At5g66520-like [Andrographis paniculata]
MIERVILLIPQCTTLNHLKQIHANLIKLPADLTALISFAAASGSPPLFSYAAVVFRSLRRRTTFQYNTVIAGYARTNQPERAVSCYKDMLQEGLIRNNYTFTPLVKACSILAADSPATGLSAHGHVLKLGFFRDLFIATALIDFYASNFDMSAAVELFDEMPAKDVVLWTAMINGYGKIGDAVNARKVFDEMPDRNVVSWSAIMAAYSQSDDFREVLCLYKRMEQFELKPNESIIVTALTACARLGALAQGLWIHSYAEKCRYTSNPILATALVDMYSKCGRIDLALLVFEKIRDRDTGAWNAIISGVAMTGNASKALELFDGMVASGTRANEATFVALLTACTHAKWIDLGLSLFEDMSSVYAIEPKIEHCGCIVDLLARSGRLEEAERFVCEKMGGIGNADGNVWGALLGACRIYGRVEIGDRLWRELTSEGSPDYGIYVLAYNMYREAGWGAEAKRVRSLLEQKRMKKTPGCSTIEVDGVVEEFLAGDVLHPHAAEVCGVLCSMLCRARAPAAAPATAPAALYEYDDEATYMSLDV